MDFDSQNRGGDSRQRVRLRVMGVSYSQIQSGAYAMILAQVDGPYRIPVVVGAAEAQSVAIKLEGIIPPRPMTHDLFTSLAQAFSLHLEEVFIHKFEDGIFSSAMIFRDADGKEVILDARTSDAVAIAMRTGSPIFTTPEILEETGFIMEIREEGEGSASRSDDPAPQTLENLPTEKLRELMASHIENEEYEEAARIKAILTSREASDRE